MSFSFKDSGPKIRPERVKPAASAPDPEPTNTTPLPPSWSQSRRSSSSSTASFHSARFPPDEESQMVASSHELKAQANKQFTGQDYSSAISTYDRALAELPNYLDYEMAVLHSNIAACHLKLEQWKEAVESCEKGLEGLERELPTKPKEKAKLKSKKDASAKTRARTKSTSDSDSDSESEQESTPRNGVSAAQGKPSVSDQDDTVVELPSDADETATLAALESLKISDERKADIHRIRTKLLLRRARARSLLEPQNWTNLSGALEDYKTLSAPEYFTTLPVSDQKTIRQALVSLPPRVNEAKEKEVSEMMGKLKELGNGILKPFGLSTENFKVVQGEGGGYSLSFDGGAGKK
ncbi:hypothetical protein HRR83_004733 [Exophiala dermatitidis]|uniref:Tetratricopeptide repeat protein 1 n=1 Tax=Exophiala dermatitidis TaxID=5970 RepID=A0AAN6F228_EXODE|nr:hypothetical protein HRR75_003653 [Exophiala dermatitidis]KAJ4519245.1 hypothetical protein HRR74_003986 [Exophiala dermatitidis]KAJ4529061.1 hypothetical protein HRR73_000081 [Exophiala dermatitidis]KAJ4538459.1 hypothetical protein HRR77_006943 [Exophiala dermatitidis]KAJ4544294.1 hypothetical protein HRR76_002360 [Exophiala dermatitidis]